MALDYATYLHLPQLLQLQQPRSVPAEHDEYLFIIAHQTYELWFKLLLVEFDKICLDFTAGNLYGALGTFQRVRAITKVLVEQMDVMETLTPLQFNSFRNRLEQASGFQSAQFRELEFLLGYKRAELLRFFAPDSPGYAAITARLHAPSVNDRLHTFLEQEGVLIPPDLRARAITLSAISHPDLETELVRLYRTRPDLVLLFEQMTDFDQMYQQWRYRHVKLVERTIGNKPGTGGSLGVEFLKQSLFQHVFPVLWAIRHRF
jgi:tryptophan 2,3-dioxygenase